MREFLVSISPWVSPILNWTLFIALIPMAFVWLRRTYRIFVRRDYSEVALKRGESPPHPEKWATAVALLNLACGLVAVWILVGLPFWVATGIRLGPFLTFDNWNAVAGSTIWVKIFGDFIISRQAHPFSWGRKKKQA